MRPPLDREAEFRRLFADYNRHVLAYVLRRTSERADAEDIVAGTFAVAWRRFGDAPAEELRLAWLYAIAARVLANQRRSARRLVVDGAPMDRVLRRQRQRSGSGAVRPGGAAGDRAVDPRPLLVVTHRRATVAG